MTNPPHHRQTPTSDDGGGGEEGGAYHYPAGGEESADGEWVVDDSFRQQRGNSAAEELNAVYGEYVDLYEQDGAASGADGDDTGDGWDEDEVRWVCVSVCVRACVRARVCVVKLHNPPLSSHFSAASSHPLRSPGWLLRRRWQLGVLRGGGGGVR